jgi:hypothetical protein
MGVKPLINRHLIDGIRGRGNPDRTCVRTRSAKASRETETDQDQGAMPRACRLSAKNARNNKLIVLVESAKQERVVPIAMECIPLECEQAHVCLRDSFANWIRASVQSGTDDEPRAGGGIADQIHDRLVGPERTLAPVDGDEREEAMLDLVPLAGARREVADVDFQPVLVGEVLESGFPHAKAISVATPGVGGSK